MAEPAKILLFCAHPDDAEIHAGGLIAAHRERGSSVRAISVTDGSAGHHEKSGPTLADIRRHEAAQSGDVLGIDYHVWPFPDGRLQPSLEVRERIIREIRTFAPELVLTHRPNDYHPDHRAVGQAVQDASYMVTVPPICSEAPALRVDPVVALLPDLFTRPCPLRPDVILDVTARLETTVRMLACHRSQVFEWLPYNQRIEDQIPADEDGKIRWLTEWVRGFVGPRTLRFASEIAARLPGADLAGTLVEVFEISEYAGKLSPERRERLFPGGR